jgi:hypothetical protein
MNGAPEPASQNVARNGIWFALHLLFVYAIAEFASIWLAGRVHGTILPLITQRSVNSTSSFQFAFSHLFVFSFFPALLVGFVYSAWFRQRTALFVWIVPLAILAYKIVTFPTTAFQSHFAVALHEYFAGDFRIPEFYSYEDLARLVMPSPDAQRGLEQLRYTAPLYAALGYSVGAFLAMRHRIAKVEATLQRFRPSWRAPQP